MAVRTWLAFFFVYLGLSLTGANGHYEVNPLRYFRHDRATVKLGESAAAGSLHAYCIVHTALAVQTDCCRSR